MATAVGTLPVTSIVRAAEYAWQSAIFMRLKCRRGLNDSECV